MAKEHTVVKSKHFANYNWPTTAERFFEILGEHTVTVLKASGLELTSENYWETSIEPLKTKVVEFWNEPDFRLVWAIFLIKEVDANIYRIVFPAARSRGKSENDAYKEADLRSDEFFKKFK